MTTKRKLPTTGTIKASKVVDLVGLLHKEGLRLLGKSGEVQSINAVARGFGVAPGNWRGYMKGSVARASGVGAGTLAKWLRHWEAQGHRPIQVVITARGVTIQPIGEKPGGPTILEYGAGRWGVVDV